MAQVLLNTFFLENLILLQMQQPEVFCKKCVLQNLAKFTRKHLRQSLFQALGLQLYSKRDFDANVFCEFCKNFKNPFLYKEHAVAASAKHLSVCTTTSHTTNRSSLSEGFFEKDALKICSKVTGEHPCRSAISIKLLYWNLKLYWNLTSA